MGVLPVREGQPFTPDSATAQRIRTAIKNLVKEIRPRFGNPLSESDAELKVRGLIGTVALGPNHSLEIAPKIDTDADWLQATIDLVESRVGLGAPARIHALPRLQLRQALAEVYAIRLLAGLQRDGPLAIIERRAETLGVLKGRLQTSRWLAAAAIRPHRFPVSYDTLTTDNDFTRAMARVAGLLGATGRGSVRSRLASAARRLRPGAPESFVLDPAVALRRLPPQYAAYQPAWTIAAAVLGRRGLLGATGQRRGFSVVVETWPLLETLLERTLRSAARLATREREPLRAKRGKEVLLVPVQPSPLWPRNTKPDGRLVRPDGSTLATFEAKYKLRQQKEWPPREDVFQAVCTAAACRSPLSVLVYPGSFDDCVWDVNNTPAGPRRLAAVGLDLFAYRRGSEEQRGRRILELVRRLSW